MCVNTTRSIVTKLLVLVIFIFIICLPDLFNLYKVSKVNLVCLPCERDKPARKMSCDPPLIPGGEEWHEKCNENEVDRGPTSEDARGEEPQNSWYLCETQRSAAESYKNNTLSAENVHVEVSVKLQLGDANFLKLTLYGHSNSSSLRLQPPVTETDDGGHSVASYCCLPASPNSETSDHVICMLRLSNYTIPSATDNKKFLKTQEDEWGAVFRVLWLVLLCVVLLTLTTAFFRQMKRCRCCCKKVHRFGYGFTGQQLKVACKGAAGRNHHSYEPHPRSGLSSIEEVEVADDVETVLDGHVDHCYGTANLYHRPTVSFPHKGAELVMAGTQL